DEFDSKVTNRPLAEIAGLELYELPSSSPLEMLTRTVSTAPGSSKTPSASVSRSRTKTSRLLFVSLQAARLVALETKVTKRPSADTTGRTLSELAWRPVRETLTRTVLTAPGSSKTPSASVSRSRTRMSEALFVSPSTRSSGPAKATNRPLAEMVAIVLPEPDSPSVLVRL